MSIITAYSKCIHNKENSRCKTCNPLAFCEHNIEKRFCIPCKGSAICEHNKRKSRCICCKGGSICEHNKRKEYCIDCGGSAICQHKIRRQICKICKGSQICIHNKQKNYCNDCGGNSLCKNCKITFGNFKYNGYCVRCCVHLFPEINVCKNYKTKEKTTAEYITSFFTNFTWIIDKKIENGCSKKRPDLLLDLGYQIIIIEIDENQHNEYDCSCENKRLMEISQDVGHRPIIFIRFNPDNYINYLGNKVKSCWSITKITGMIKIENKKHWNKRLECLKSQIEYWTLPEHKSEKTIEIIHLFYNGFNDSN